MGARAAFAALGTYVWIAGSDQVLARLELNGGDPARAFDALTREGPIPLGILYRDTRPTFEERSGLPQTPIVRPDLGSSAERYAAIQTAYR